MREEDKATRALLDPILREENRRLDGPACALCRHVPLTIDDWPDIRPWEPTDGKDAIRTADCPVRRLRVFGGMGAKCPDFRPKETP